jgi:hypothetical protein
LHICFPSKIFDSSSPTENSRWSFHPRNGLTIKNATVSDSSIYYVVSYLRFVNGKRVDIKHDKTTDEFLSWIIPPDELNYSSVMQFSLIVEGNTIEMLPSRTFLIINVYKIRSGNETVEKNI